MPSLRHNLGKITFFFFSLSFFSFFFVIPLFLLHGVAVVKLGCLFHPVVEAGRSLPGKGKAPPTKGSIPSSLPPAARIRQELGDLPLPSTARAGRAAWADAGWERGRKLDTVPKNKNKRGKKKKGEKGPF